MLYVPVNNLLKKNLQKFWGEVFKNFKKEKERVKFFKMTSKTGFQPMCFVSFALHTDCNQSPHKRDWTVLLGLPEHFWCQSLGLLT